MIFMRSGFSYGFKRMMLFSSSSEEIELNDIYVVGMVVMGRCCVLDSNFKVDGSMKVVLMG